MAPYLKRWENFTVLLKPAVVSVRPRFHASRGFPLQAARSNDMKDIIRNFILNLGVDDVGFASAGDYCSPNSPALEALFPGARSQIVLAFRDLSS